MLNAAIAFGNVMGLQFHPERSGPDGLRDPRALCEELTQSCLTLIKTSLSSLRWASITMGTQIWQQSWLISLCEVGADAVKFQTFEASALVTSTAEKARYQKAATKGAESQREMLEQLQLDVETHFALMRQAQALDLQFMSTAFDSESLNFLVKELDLTDFKDTIRRNHQWASLAGIRENGSRSHYFDGNVVDGRSPDRTVGSCVRFGRNWRTLHGCIQAGNCV